ncbi:MAG: hypothetical protein K2H79_09385, partial [Bacteroidaceae bacterium]|nr:hypothetical protein [Bacteroidaceae bacterium]
MIRIKRLLILWLLLSLVSPSKSQVRPQPVEIAEYACLHTDAGKDSLQFPGDTAAFMTFYRKLERLFTEGEGSVNILHIGGSHVQAGFFSHRVRSHFAMIDPSVVGGRGMLFPYVTLGTNAPKSYSLTSQGVWTGQRCLARSLEAPLGLSGALVTTRDTLARLKLVLSSLEPWKVSRLRVLGEAESDSITPVLVCGENLICPSFPDEKPGYCFDLPSGADTCTITFSGIWQDSLGFRVRGILPEGHLSGITYTASGINGAAVPSWLSCSKFEEELAVLPPDLVIFGIGINDANVLPQKFDKEAF